MLPGRTITDIQVHHSTTLGRIIFQVLVLETCGAILPTAYGTWQFWLSFFLWELTWVVYLSHGFNQDGKRFCEKINWDASVCERGRGEETRDETKILEIVWTINVIIKYWVHLLSQAFFLRLYIHQTVWGWWYNYIYFTGEGRQRDQTLCPMSSD